MKKLFLALIICIIGINIFADDFEIENNKLIKYNGNDTEVFIPENVKIIGEDAFNALLISHKYSNVREIFIPDNVTEIEMRAFNGFKDLKKIYLSGNIEKMDCSFYDIGNCELEILTSDNHTVYRGYHYFTANGSLFSTDYYKPSYRGVDYVPKNKTHNGEYDCHFNSIGSFAFMKCNYSSINLWCEEVCPNAFSKSPNLKKITIKSNCFLRRYSFFNLNNLEKIVIERPVSIYDNAFADCQKLKTIVIKNTNTLASIYGVYNNKNSLAQINKIGEQAFFNCISLEGIRIYNCSEIKEKAFGNCKNLKNVYIYQSDQIEIADDAFENCPYITVTTNNSKVVMYCKKHHIPVNF